MAESGQSDRKINPPRPANGRQDGAENELCLAAQIRASSFLPFKGHQFLQTLQIPRNQLSLP
jgi:hypothetical protein